ncbi:MAG TPA: OmpA family protein [Polyangiaceae bacterium]|nr:OmpA family protein [Polyangiaceae bacterium]
MSTKQIKASMIKPGLATMTAGLLLACGAATAPMELHSAEDAMLNAEHSKAPDVAPVKLEEARQALAKAEQAFKDGDDEDHVKTLAYVAQRSAELAVSVGNQEFAKKQSADAMKDKMQLQGVLLEATTEELADRKKLEAASKIGAEEVARVKGELDKERAAREGAEARAAAALAQIAKVSQEKRGMVITLSGEVLFTTGRSELLPMARQKLSDVAKALKEQGYKHLRVEGHTDSRGAPSQNEALSLRRAQAVRSYLVSEGIDSDKIEAVGNGSREPIADNATADGRANNRRVEIVVDPVN